MGKSSRAYRSAKRSKELARLQKKEEKRLKRLKKKEEKTENGVESSPEDESSES